LGLLPLQERDRLRIVPRRATRQAKLQRVAERLDQHLHLCAEPAARSAEALRRLIPLYIGSVEGAVLRSLGREAGDGLRPVLLGCAVVC
jgi:hypothetical protein